MLTKEAIKIAHTLSDPSKMPGKSYSLPTHACQTGSTLREIEGSVCSKCYADNRGNYRFDNVKSALEKRLASITHENWAEAMVQLIMGEEWFRWLDSGDIQSVEMFGKLTEIAEALPETNFWLPTKERGMIQKWGSADTSASWPTNLNVRWSMPMIDQLPNLNVTSKTGKLPDLRYSAVSTKLKVKADLRTLNLRDEKYFVCEAHTRHNQCGYCRACWDTSIPVIVYPYH